ncbi:MAG: glycosyltransferase family 2 protein [Candidatus Gastranaerophilales bacterium]|nr:glycosyltransferase family 2 protein [Candidatus Gastranaerophilales bacterium]
MLNNKKIVIVMPAYNAQATLKKTYEAIPHSIVDDIVLVDDCSSDATIEIAKSLKIKTITHEKNLGYGANQKTCYQEALKLGADIVIMLHPDFQYDPRLIPALASMIAYDNYDCALASRMLVGSAKNSKMPKYKYFANKFLTAFQNLFLNKNLSEYHTGYRAFSAEVLKSLPYEKMDNDFIFDNEMLALIYYKGFSIGEISCPTKYFDGASSINFMRSTKYGFGVLKVSLLYRLAKLKFKTKLFFD